MRPIPPILALLLLAACSSDRAGPAGSVEAVRTPSGLPAADRQPEPDRPPVPEPRPAIAPRGADTDAPGPGRQPAPDNSATPLDLDALAGVDRDEVLARLGPADDVRDQPPGMVWIYREGACSVELYLFPQVAAARYSVLGHKVLPASLGDRERRSCLTRLATRTRKS